MEKLLNRLERVGTLASIVSYLAAAFYLAYIGTALYFESKQGFAGIRQNPFTLFSLITLLLTGLFYFAVLQAISAVIDFILERDWGIAEEQEIIEEEIIE